MAVVTEVLARISADPSRFVSGMGQASAAADNFNEATLGAEAKTKGLFGTIAGGAAIGGVLAGGLAMAGSAAMGFGQQVLGQAMNMQQAEIAFTNFLGSAENAQKFLGDLSQFAAKTPFEFPDLVASSKQMMAFGFETKQIIPMMTALGDASAGLGLGAEGISRITRALGQMKMKGVASGEQMAMLAEAGIPAWKYLADTLDTDVATAMKMVEKKTVDADTAIQAIVNGMENGTATAQGFGGMMEEQSKTLEGVLSTFKDTVMASLVQGMKPLVQVFTDFITVATPVAEVFSQKLGGAISTLVGTLTNLLGAIGPVLEIFKAIPAPVYAIIAVMLATNKIVGGVGLVLNSVGQKMRPFTDGIKSIGTAWSYAGQEARRASGDAATFGQRLKEMSKIVGGGGGVVSGGFKALKAAGSGLFGLMGGPWGLALGGATLALSMYQQKQEETKAAVEALTGSLDRQSGALTNDTYILIAKALKEAITEAEEWTRLTDAGFGMDKTIAALAQGGQALEDYKAQLDAASKAATRSGDAKLQYNLSALKDVVNAQSDALADSVTQWEINKAAADAAAAAQKNAATQAALSTPTFDAASAALGRHAYAETQVKTQADLTAAAIKGVDDAFAKLNGLLSRQDAQDNMTRSLQAMRESIKENGKSFEGNTEKALANREALRGSIQSVMDYAGTFTRADSKAKAFSKGIDTVTQTLAGMKLSDAQIRELMKPFNLTKEQMDEVIAKANAAKNPMYQAGVESGEQLPIGTGVGIDKGKSYVINAAVRMAVAAKLAANKELGISSPSKVFIAIGQFVGEGLAIGIRSQFQVVSSTARGLANTIVASLNSRQAAIIGAAYTSVQNASRAMSRAQRAADAAAARVTRAQAAVYRAQGAAARAAAEKELERARNAQSKADAFLAEAKLNFENAKKDAKGDPLAISVARSTAVLERWKKKAKEALDYMASVKDTMSDFGSLKNYQPGNGRMPNATDMVASMQERLNQIKKFGADINKLKAAGLHPGVLADIISLGPIAGSQMAEALLAEPNLIKGKGSVSDLYTQIQAAAAVTAGAAGAGVYGMNRAQAEGVLATNVSVANGAVQVNFNSGVSPADRARIKSEMETAITNALQQLAREIQRGGS